MEKISTKDLVEAVASRTGQTKATTKQILKEAAAVIKIAAVNGQETQFCNLGRFAPVDRAARTARNPLTGAAIEVPARRALAFKPSASMKDLK